jgi:orotate phosphoribosyltransferase-like protein
MKVKKKNMINKEINELRMKIDNIKGEETRIWIPQKKELNRNAKQNGRAIQQNRTSRRKNLRIKDEMVIKGKTEELLVKQLKNCEKNMQELTDSIKRPNLRIMSIEEGEKGQAKGMHTYSTK